MLLYNFFLLFTNCKSLIIEFLDFYDYCTTIFSYLNHVYLLFQTKIASRAHRTKEKMVLKENYPFLIYNISTEICMVLNFFLSKNLLIILAIK